MGQNARLDLAALMTVAALTMGLVLSGASSSRAEKRMLDIKGDRAAVITRSLTQGSGSSGESEALHAARSIARSVDLTRSGVTSGDGQRSIVALADNPRRTELTRAAGRSVDAARSASAARAASSDANATRSLNLVRARNEQRSFRR